MTMPAPDPAPDPAARGFVIISAIRLAGIAALLGGIAVLAGALPWPAVIGILLVVAGMFVSFLAPPLLARRWSSRRRP